MFGTDSNTDWQWRRTSSLHPQSCHFCLFHPHYLFPVLPSDLLLSSIFSLPSSLSWVRVNSGCTNQMLTYYLLLEMLQWVAVMHKQVSKTDKTKNRCSTWMAALGAAPNFGARGPPSAPCFRKPLQSLRISALTCVRKVTFGFLTSGGHCREQFGYCVFVTSNEWQKKSLLLSLPGQMVTIWPVSTVTTLWQGFYINT